MDGHRRHVRWALALVLCTSALVALVAAGGAAAKNRPSKGQGQAIVMPASVKAGAKAKTLRFTFLATTNGAASGGKATFAFPRNWPAPKTQKSAAGGVTVKPTGCSHVSIAGVSGSVVTVQMTCKTTQTFSLTYGKVTVPGQPGQVAFKVRTADGMVKHHKHRFGALHPIATSPLLTVSGKATGTPTVKPAGKTGGKTSATTATRFAVSAPSSAAAGTSAHFTVTAQDGSGHTVTGYAGTVHFTSSDNAAVLPGNAHLTGGVGTFTVLLKTIGKQTITATDTGKSLLTGSSGSISVGPGQATRLTVTAPSSGAAGSALTFTVKAIDPYGNTATGYGGTVHFTSSANVGNLPADSKLSAGTGTFTATPTAAGAQSITATDTASSSISGTSGSISVGAGPTSKFTVSPSSSSTAAGAAFTFVVTAQDQFGNTSSYGGTVHFTSSDAAAVLPANSTLTNGTGTFSATLKTAGAQTLTATDSASSSITGTSASVTVAPGAATQFAVSAPATATHGSAFNFTVTALDQFDNTVTGYSGTVHFTSSDAAAVLPANSTLTNGTRTFSATLNTTGGQTITATDTAAGSVTGHSSTITVG